MTAIDVPLVVNHLEAIIDHLQALRLLLDSHNTVDAGVMMVARAVQGEGAAMFGPRRDEVGEWIAHIAFNRYEKEWWQEIDGVPCTFAERTEHDFHGVALVDEPDNWAIRLAYEVITARREGGEDGARGALFAMTLEDLERHGWLERAREVLVQVVSAPDVPVRQFWFMFDDPASLPNPPLHKED
jgi:hypothetical protein